MEHEKHHRNWHRRHVEGLTLGQQLSDSVANFMGSWPFIIIQTGFVIVWMGVNVTGVLMHWDPYPFILLNLLFSTQAAYAAPIIMMSQNRASERDRLHAEEDYRTNVEAKQEIEKLQLDLSRIENEKLNHIIRLLDK